jgi:hypothetical protein
LTPLDGQTLERLLLPLERPRIEHCAGFGHPAWMTAGSWRVLARPRSESPRGAEVERFTLASGETRSAVATDAGPVWVPFDLDEAYSNYVTEGWRRHADVRALSPRQLDLYYRVKSLIPASWLLAARRLYVRWSGLPEFPSWPADESVVQLLRFYAYCLLASSDTTEERFRWFWPRGYRGALILTHDVESAEGLRLAPDLADLEEARGLRSSFNVVGGDYPIDYGVLRELQARGFEVGLHGLRHDRSLFASRDAFEEALPSLAARARDFGAEGFRSPATHRVPEWLGELPLAYDCSIPHSDPYEPQPGGCCSLWPFFLGEVVELPYTLPQDHTLFTLLRARSVELWLAQVDLIEQRFGLVQCLSHPDPGYLGDRAKRDLYAEFLDSVVDKQSLWKPLPREVAAWWRHRETANVTDPDLSFGTIRRDASSPFASLEPPATASPDPVS